MCDFWGQVSFLGCKLCFLQNFQKFFQIPFNEAKTHPNHISSCEFDNMTKKMCCTPYPLKTAIFYTKMGPNGSKKFFFIIFLFVFLHRYLVFHKMFILHLFRKLKTKKLIKCVIFGKKGHFGTKKGVNDPKNNFFQKFFLFSLQICKKLSFKPMTAKI